MLIKRHFTSALELARYIESTPPMPGAGKSSSYGGHHEPEWYRNQDWETAQDILLNHGGYWREGAAAIRDARTRISAPVSEAVKVAFKRDYAGARPHVPAHLAGSPKSMVRRQTALKPAPVIRVAVNIGVTADDDEREAFYRGAALLSAIKAVESAGTRVELCGFSYAQDAANVYPGTREFLVTVDLKAANALLSVGDLSYMTCHCNALRRHMFAVREREPEFYRVTSAGSYGLSINPDNFSGYDIVVPKIGTGYKFTSPDRAMNTINRLFESFTAKEK